MNKLDVIKIKVLLLRRRHHEEDEKASNKQEANVRKVINSQRTLKYIKNLCKYQEAMIRFA